MRCISLVQFDVSFSSVVVVGTMVIINDEIRVILKIASVLLHYPDKALIEAREDVKEVVDSVLTSHAKVKLGHLLTYIETTPLMRLQEEYTATFDLNPATSLNLTYHTCGNGRERGSALADLQDLFRNAGYLMSTRELPDYLPLILEFLSVSPQEGWDWFVPRYGNRLSDLAARLREQASPYADLVEVVTESVEQFRSTGGSL